MGRSSRYDRGFGLIGRATIERISDDPKLQELDVNLLNDETKTKIERVQEFGFSSVPLSPSDDQSQGQGQQGGQGGSGQGQSKSKKYAMAVVAFLSGNRSHGVILGVDDRRHRPRKLKEGESIQYDDNATKFHLTRTGVEISGGDDNLFQGEDKERQQGQSNPRNKKLPIHAWTGDGHVLIEKDKETYRVGDKSSIVIEANKQTFTVGGSVVTVTPDKVTIKSDLIVLDGTVKIGGEDANTPASMKGTIDTAGDADVSNLATKVLLK